MKTRLRPEPVKRSIIQCSGKIIRRIARGTADGFEIIRLVALSTAGRPWSRMVPAYGVLSGPGQRATILIAAGIQIGALTLQWPMSLLLSDAEP